MSLPKQHLPGQTVHLTRRTTQRKFLLRNSKEGYVKNAVGYVFALAILAHGQIPHALTLMSNHTHICLSDSTGRRSKFMQRFHALIAKIMNKKLGRRENFWSSNEPGNTWLLDTQKIVETLVYIWLNPVRAGLVERVDHWDQFQILPRDWGKPMRFKRPDYFRDGDPDKPEYIEFTPQPPPGFENYPLEEVVAFFEKRITEGEEALMVARRKKKKKVMGMKKCYALNPKSSPRKTVNMFTRNPKFSSTKPKFIEAAIQSLIGFWNLYKQRLEGLKKGSRAKFPAGTIQVIDRFRLECLRVIKDPHLMEYQPYLI